MPVIHMTVIDHPTRAEARRRRDRMVAAACELACLVRDGDREETGAFIYAAATSPGRRNGDGDG